VSAKSDKSKGNCDWWYAAI